MSAPYAVLSGDLIKSEDLTRDRLADVRECLSEAAEDMNRWDHGLRIGDPDFFQGDAWQMSLSDAKWALRAMILMRASLLAQGLADTRVAVGIGTVEYVAEDRTSLSEGEAFTLSGRALNEMTQYFDFDVVVSEDVGYLAGWLRAIAHLSDSLVRQWTQRQAEIIRLALSPERPTHKAISQKLDPPISRQAVSKSLSEAGWHGIRSATEQLEGVDWAALWPTTGGAT